MLRDYCKHHGLDNVVFTGFVNQSDLPALYAASDIFVLPSQDEPWGLAINEAMCAGLPIIVSREVGCAIDLVKDGENGFTPAAGDIEGLACALRDLVIDAELRRRQGEASRARIQQWGYRECLEGIRLALRGLGQRGTLDRGSAARRDVGGRRQRCAVLPVFMLIIMRPIRSIVASCIRFAIIWPRVARTASVNGIRKTSGSDLAIAGSASSTCPNGARSR